MAQNHKATHEATRARLRDQCTGIVELDKATIYTNGMMGVRKQEVKGLTIGLGPYAQYSAATRWAGVQKGKRKPFACAVGHQPHVLVLEGYGHTLDQKWLVALEDDPGTRQSKYASCDPRWATDFQTQAKAWLAENPKAKVAFVVGWDL